MKYTKEKLEEAVKASISINGVMKYFGVKITGGNHSHFSRKIKTFDLDTSHFLGKVANQGPNHKGGTKRLTPDDVFAWNRPNRPPAKLLRKTLLAVGVPHKCDMCGLGSTWNGQFIQLEIDHINRNWKDNSRNNLRFLCPNCHSQV